MTGRDIVADLEAVRAHLASDKYLRAARAATIDLAAYEVWDPSRLHLSCVRFTFPSSPQPYVIQHSKFPSKLFCTITKLTLNKVITEVVLSRWFSFTAAYTLRIRWRLKSI